MALMFFRSTVLYERARSEAITVRVRVWECAEGESNVNDLASNERVCERTHGQYYCCCCCCSSINVNSRSSTQWGHMRSGDVHARASELANARILEFKPRLVGRRNLPRWTSLLKNLRLPLPLPTRRHERVHSWFGSRTNFFNWYFQPRLFWPFNTRSIESFWEPRDGRGHFAVFSFYCVPRWLGGCRSTLRVWLRGWTLKLKFIKNSHSRLFLSQKLIFSHESLIQSWNCYCLCCVDR